MSEFLNQDEVDALLSDFSDDQPDTKKGSMDPSNYDLSKQERIIRGRLPTLEIIQDRVLRQLRHQCYILLRKTVEISHKGIKPQKYSEWIKNLPFPSSLNIIHLKGLRGNGLIVIDPALVFAFVDSLYGGTGIQTRIEGRDFSPTEQQLLNRLIGILIDSFEKAWQNILPVKFEFIRSEIYPQFATIATSSEIVLNTQFTIEVNNLSGQFWLCLPYASIEPIKSLLANDLQNDTDRKDNRWNAVISNHIANLPVELVAEFKGKKTTLKELETLKVNDIIYLDNPTALIKMQQQLLFTGTVGSYNNNKAIQIDTIEYKKDNNHE